MTKNGFSILLVLLLTVMGTVIDAQAQDAQAQDAEPKGNGYKAGDLVITSPWTRATAASAMVAAGYLSISNQGPRADRLIGASFSQAGKTEIHEMNMQKGVMHMQEVEGGLTIAPGKTVELKPGGYHLMFSKLEKPLAQGDTIEGVLNFEKAGSVNVTYTVGGMGQKSMGQKSMEQKQE